MRNYGGSALMLLVTIAAAVGSYTVNLKVSGERAAVDTLRRQIVADARDMRNLQAELRTRARFPEMQRWNDSVLQMSAPSAAQYLRSPVQLASFGAPAAAAPEPGLRYAVTAPQAVAPPPPAVVRASYERPAPVIAPQPTASLVRASYPVTPHRSAPVATDALAADIGASIDASATVGTPHDLLPDGGH